MPGVEPDREILATFFDALFRHADRDGFINLRSFEHQDDKGNERAFFIEAVPLSAPYALDRIVDRATRTAAFSKPAVFAPPICTFRDRGSAAGANLANGLEIVAECDERPAAAYAALVPILGEPTLVVASGGFWTDPDTGEIEEKLHLHWRLSAPTRSADQHARLREARAMVARIVKADHTSISIVHPLRWAGSVHTKHTPRLSKIVSQTENEVDLDESLTRLRAACPEVTGPHVACEGPVTASHEDVASAMATIPNDDLPWAEWKSRGMAVWAATEGQGFDIFDAWSRRSSKYDAAATAEAWGKIRRSPPGAIGAGSIFHAANQVDPSWVRPSMRVDDGEFAEVVAIETAAISEPPVAPAPRAGSFPDALTRVPGLLGQAIDWIVATDKRPNRVLALGAAVTVLGTLMGRRMAGPTLSGTHLYVIGLAPSGAGKDHGLHQAMRLLKAAYQEQFVGPSGFMSYSALVKYIFQQPLSLCIMDELGAFLKKLSHKRAGVHEQGITAILRSAWGASFQTLRTPEWSGQPSKEIVSPAMSIYGVSVPEEFFSAMQGSDVTNGFLNRFLLLETERSAVSETVSDPFEVPDDLRQDLVNFHLAANQLDPRAVARPWDETRPHILSWGAGAEAVYRTMEAEIETLRSHPEQGPFYARTVEMAVRLATVRAAGQDFRPVSQDDMEWGRDVALWSARRMVEAADEHMAGNDFAAYQNRIIAYMRRRSEPVTRRDMQRAVQSELTVRQLNDAIETMVQAGRIVPMAVKREGKGRSPPTHYRLA